MSRKPISNRGRRYYRPCVEPLEDRRLLAAVITVSSTADTNARDAALTLREAILINNRTLSVASLTALELLQVVGLPTNSDADTIRFNIPPTDAGHVYFQNDGVAGQVTPANVASTTAADDAAIADIDPDWPNSWFSIRPTSAPPNTTDPLIIDGYTQPGAKTNSNPAGQGLNTILKIEINGENAGTIDRGLIGVGLTSVNTGAGGTTIKGLVLNRTSGPKITFDFFAPGNRVEGNFLGPDVSGTVVFPPPVVSPLPGFLRSNGVFSQAGGDTIGGTTPDQRNLISGNNFLTTSLDAAVLLRGFSSPTLVQGNLIGTDRTATKVLGNVGYGVLVDSPNNVIGGPETGAGNVIAGSQSSGIYAASGNNTGGVIQGNWIGTDDSGTLDLGNAGPGILFGNFAGGNRAEANTIAFNRSGIQISTQNQLITRNSIFANDELGLVGPQHFPALATVSAVAGGTRINGTQAGTAGEVFRLEFFANPERDETIPTGTFVVPGTLGEGKTFLGDLVVTIPAGGTASFEVDLPVDLLALPGVGGQPFVTATATDITDDGSGPRNKTSEFSPVAVLGGPSFVVTTTADTGLGTLREAIISANLTTGLQTITFAIPPTDARHFYYKDDGVAGEVSLANITPTTAATDATIPTTGEGAIDPDWPHSWFSIQPSRTLPEIIDTITIDGYSQPGSIPNALAFPQGLNTVLKIELDGTNAAGDGLNLGFDASHSTIKGLTINRFGGDGIELGTLDGGNALTGNFIGTDVSGTVDLGNREDGVFVNIENAAENVFGGGDAASRNLISGNEVAGIEIFRSLHVRVQGNIIGADRLTNPSVVNTVAPIVALESSFIGIGGTQDGDGNILATAPLETMNEFTGEDTIRPMGSDNPVAGGLDGFAFLIAADALTDEVCVEPWDNFKLAVRNHGDLSRQAFEAYKEWQKCIDPSLGIRLMVGMWMTRNHMRSMALTLAG